MTARRAALALAIVVASAGTAWAHKPSDAQLHLTSNGAALRGRLDVSLRDLDAALGIDTNGNGEITWAEVRAAEPRLAQYVTARLTITADGAPCTLALGTGALVDLIDGAYWAVPLDVRCPTRPAAIAISYRLLFDLDAQHRGILHVDGHIKVVRDGTPARLELAPALSRTPPALAALWTVATGIDHLLVLALVILPLGVWRRRGRTRTAMSIRATVERIAAFTLAQLVTLALIAWGVLQLPALVGELAIGVSIVALAFAVIVRGAAIRWQVAFEVGLLQGFSLAIAMSRLGPPTGLPMRTLVAFDLGVVVAYAALGATLIAIAARATRPRG